MATWITHLRIAEKLIDSGLPVSYKDFLVGNIGPDCGLYEEDGQLIPPKEITHFMVDGKINAEYFYSQYLEKNEKGIEKNRLSFYWGYYFHLVTDQEWSKFYKEKKKEKNYQDIHGIPEYWKLIKRDWYGIDFQYLETHKDSIFWSVFKNIKQFPDYLSFFPKGQVCEQIKRITNLYLNSTMPDDYEFVYLTHKEVDDFVEHTVNITKGR